jgi:hypothetical protein
MKDTARNKRTNSFTHTPQQYGERLTPSGASLFYARPLLQALSFLFAQWLIIRDF